VALVDAGERRNRWVEQTHGYLGLDPTDPSTIIDRATEALLRYPTAEIVHGQVGSASRRPDGNFSLDLEDGTQLVSRRVVLCTGVEDQFPEVDGFFEHYGASVFHCPTCDGYEARDCEVVVFGWSEAAAGFALSLLDWAARVTLVTDGSGFEGDASCRIALERHEVDVLEDDAVALQGRRGDLRGVELRSGTTIGCQLAFFSIAHHPRTDLAVLLGCDLTEEGCIVVDDHGETTVSGVYAAGDVIPGLQLVQVAAAKGAIAGVACALSLRGEGPGPDAPSPGPDAEAEVSG
jgi:thioredoxin reductase